MQVFYIDDIMNMNLYMCKYGCQTRIYEIKSLKIRGRYSVFPWGGVTYFVAQGGRKSVSEGGGPGTDSTTEGTKDSQGVPSVTCHQGNAYYSIQGFTLMIGVS